MAIPENKRRYHIIFDAYNCDFLPGSELERIIRDLARLCGMRLLLGPIVVEGVPDNPGYTAFAVIDFSHISIHTFSDAREVCVDVFSCKKFDEGKVRSYLVENFGEDFKSARVIY